MAIYQGDVLLGQGARGKSAYNYAVDGGYTGTEEEFKAEITKILELDTSVSSLQSSISDISDNIAELEIKANNRETILGTGEPTSSTSGTIGQLYKDTLSERIFICEGIDGNTYTWVKMLKESDITIWVYAASSTTSGYPDISTIDHKYLVIDVADNNILKYYDSSSSSWKPIVSVWS